MWKIELIDLVKKEESAKWLLFTCGKNQKKRDKNKKENV